MRASKRELTEDVETKGLNMRGADWGEMRVGWETHRESTDFTPVFKGLPDNLCTTPHWGYVIRGGFLAKYKDGREEHVGAGDVYYLETPHTVITEPETELVEFSPRETLGKMFEVVQKNFESWIEGKK